MPLKPKQRTTRERSGRRRDRRPSAARRGYDKRWSKARRAFLSRPENALCRTCEARGRLTSATVVDHITPHRGDRVLFWNQSNWQPLCGPCHSRKTAAEDGGFGNPRKGNHERSNRNN